MILLLSFFSIQLTLISQNSDIHSFDHQQDEELEFKYIDSLKRIDLHQAYKLTMSKLEKPLAFSNPDYYTNMLEKAVYSSFLLGDLRKSDSLFKVLIDFPRKNLHPLFSARILMHQASAARIYKKPMIALELAKKASLLYIQNNDFHGQLEVFNIIIRIFFDLGNQNETLKYTNEVDGLLQIVNDPELEASILLFFAKVFNYNQNYTKAKEYLDRATHTIDVNHLEVAKANLYLNLGVHYYSQKNFSKADKYIDQSIAIKRKINSLISLSSTITYKASLAMKQERYEMAEYYNREALSIRQEVGNRYLMGSSHFNIANCLIHQSKFDSALVHIEKGEKLFSIYNVKPNIKRGNELRRRIYVRQKDFESAFKVLSEIVAIDDSVFKQLTQHKLDEFESNIQLSSYEAQKNNLKLVAQKQQDQLKLKKLVINIGLLVLLFALLSSYFLYLFIKEQNKRKLLLTNQKMVFIQMNSHFVFNALTAIQSLFYKNKIESAIHYLTIFSNLVKKVLFVSHKKIIDMQTEVAFTMEYMQLQKLRFGDILKFQIDISEDVYKRKIKIPPFLLYPFIEYAIEECVQKAGEKSFMIIRAHADKKYLYYSLVDQGLGFSDFDKCYIKRVSNEKIKCIDLSNERMSLYNHFYSKQITFLKEEFSIEQKTFPTLTFKIRI
jgi:LytS/YehU family sensor histidine kinase